MKIFNFAAIVLLANSVEAVDMRNLAQINSISPTGAQMKVIEDAHELADWGKQGSNTASYNSLERHNAVVSYAQISQSNQ